MKERKTVYKIAPRPIYDVEKTEAWLEHLAQEGLFLTKNGFFAFTGYFERRTPKKVRYRLCYSTRQPLGEQPNDVQLELMETSGWQYIASKAQFDIYMTEDSKAPEPSTDPEVEALLYKKIKNNAVSHVFYVILWTVILPILSIGFLPVMAVISLTVPVVALIGLSLLSLYIEQIAEAVYHVKIYKRLKNGKGLRHDYKWKTGFSLRKCLPVINTVLIVITVVMTCTAYKNDKKKEIPVDQYTGELPFADLGELVGGEYTRSFFGDSIKVSSSVLAPSVIEVYMVGSVGLTDGTSVQCGAVIHYYETIDKSVAVELANEYLHYDRRRNLEYYEELEPPDVGADYILAYDTIFTSVCMVKGEKFVYAYFYGYNPLGGYCPTLEEWVQRLYDSI